MRHYAWADRVLRQAIERVMPPGCGGQRHMARGALYIRDGQCLGAVTMTDHVDDAVWLAEPPWFPRGVRRLLRCRGRCRGPP